MLLFTKTTKETNSDTVALSAFPVSEHKGDFVLDLAGRVSDYTLVLSADEALQLAHKLIGAVHHQMTR